MKILKKVKLPKVTCARCGCVFRPSKNDLYSFLTFSKDYANCPICSYGNLVFKKEEKTDESTNQT